MGKHLRLVQPQLTPEARQLAGTHDLGSPTAEYTVHFTRAKLFLTVLCFLLAALFVVFGMTISALSGQLFALGGGLLFLCLGLAHPIRVFLARSWRVVVCTCGFIVAKNTIADTFRWDEVDAVWQQVAKQYYHGVYASTYHKYTIRRKDGKEIVLNDKFSHVENLGNTIGREVTRYQLPKVMTAYTAGNTITFGMFSVNIHGISTNKDWLPWQQVKDISVNKGLIVIKKEGRQFNWNTVSTSKIPNVFVFMALVDHALHSQKTDISVS